MGFSIGDIVGGSQPPRAAEGPGRPVVECPTGKTPFGSKREATSSLRRANDGHGGVMKAFRCDYCERYHLGHRRGSQ